jgi:hypothetical protein
MQRRSEDLPRCDDHPGEASGSDDHRVDKGTAGVKEENHYGLPLRVSEPLEVGQSVARPRNGGRHSRARLVAASDFGTAEQALSFHRCESQASELTVVGFE